MKKLLLFVLLLAPLFGMGQDATPSVNPDDFTFTGFLQVLALALVYFAPSIIARGHRQSTSIVLVNILLGWTVVGWVVALVWAVSKPAAVQVKTTPAQKPLSVADEITKLQALRDAGHLTADEFSQQKARLLA